MATHRVLLAGNPNCGKTSLFNHLTGAHQHVGNYPGVTVEKRTGTLKIGEDNLEITDLPGLYSLSSYSPEERVAQDQILSEGVDVVVVVADSTVLERSLVLLAQVMAMGARPVLCLNMSDEAEAAGLVLDLDAMQGLLGFPVVQTVGHQGRGQEALVQAIHAAARGSGGEPRLVLGHELEDALQAIQSRMAGSPWPRRVWPWMASRLLVGDPAYRAAAPPLALEEANRQRRWLEDTTGQDIQLYVTGRTFGFVNGLLREVVRRPLREDARAVTRAVDGVLVHPVLGLPIFGALMFLVFWVTFTLGEPPMGWIEAGFTALGAIVGRLWPEGSPSLLRGLLVDGIIGGVGGVLVFLPNILLLFLGLSLLEDTGYMSRAAFLMDRFMHRFGLHGKSFLPMITGFGCSIPGIMATRTLENERDRLTTMLVLPLMSCGARVPVYMLLVPAFFPAAWRAPVLWIIYATGVGLALVLALVLRNTLLRGEEAPFVMELPPYRLPTLRSVLVQMGLRSWLYVKKAGTVILAVSVLLWGAASFPRLDPAQTSAHCAHSLHAEACARARQLETSIAGRLGHALEPMVRPLGFDWKIATGMVGAFAAKEVFVAQMGIVTSMADEDPEGGALRDELSRNYSPAVGASLIVFLLVGTPCMATVAVTRRESGRWRWALLQLGGLTALAWGLSFLVYQAGRLIVGV